MIEKESSTYKVPLTTIREVFPHPNAEKLEYVKCYDYNVIVQKDKYKVGDVVIYVPIDSLLPQYLENILFPPDAKIKLHNHRIKQIKIRGHYSQGMVIDPKDILLPDRFELEEDLSTFLHITKYEPPTPHYQEGLVRKRDKPLENPYLHKYGGLDNFKWYPDLFEEGELVSVTEKIHGSNIRFGDVPFVANTFWKKVQKFFGLNPTHEWCYGSNNVQLQARKGYKGFYGTDVYGKVLEKYDARNKVKNGQVYYGEIYGDGIQKNYSYGCKNGEHKLIVFDLKLQTEESSKFVDPKTFRETALAAGFEVTPELYNGPFNKELVKELTKGDSVLCPQQKVREGVVIKPQTETICSMGRKVLKMISEKYLEGDNSDFH